MRLTGFFKKCTVCVMILATFMSMGCGKNKVTPVIGNVAQSESSLSDELNNKESEGETGSTVNDKTGASEEHTTEPKTEAPTSEPTEPETEAPTPEPTNPPETEAPTPEPTNPPETEAPTPEQTNPPETEAPTPEPTNPPETEAPTPEPTTQAGPGKLTAPFNIAFLGDSITVGYGSDYSYADVVCEDLKLTKYNYGHVGDTLASDEGRGLIERYTSIFEGCDVIVVYGGSNDYYKNVPLGSPDSRNKDDFYGALKKMCQGLKEKYTKSHIVFITPLRGEFAGKYNSGNNETGSSMWDYVDAIHKVCSNNGIHVIDIYNNFTINGDNFDEYTIDGLHPNEKGHDLIADELEKYIKSLM